MRNQEELRGLFLRALADLNWNDVVVHSTDLLQLEPNTGYLWDKRALGLQSMGHAFDALLNYDRAIAIEPDNAAYYTNKGAAWWDLGNAEESLKCLDRAAELDPTIAQTFMTMGNIFKHQGNIQKALITYRRCIEADPNYADGHLVLGMTLLKMGYLQEGWKEYEWRWKTNQLPPRRLKCPQWAGQDLTNKIILVYGEQGLGDIIQFSRYARVLANKFPRVKIIIEGRQALKRLLNTIPEVYAVINAGEKLPELDYAVPMLTLAGLLTPNIGAIPADEKEFILRHADIEVWKEKLEVLPQGFRVGVCWAGMARTAHPSANAIDALRSTQLSKFAELAKIKDIVWVSLQKGQPSEQVKTPPAGMTIGDFTDDMHDFYETACAATNCDLVITVDTAVAHAAASVGVPTWILSRWDGCWRWFGDRPDSPWYPTVRQFVQPAPGDWDGMMKNVEKELTKLVRHKNVSELDLTLAK